MKQRPATEIVYPIAGEPEPGSVIEVAPGILWSRLPLPYAPFHVNTYLIEDRGGWVAVETGLDDEPTRDAWNRLFLGPLRGSRLTRVLPTHWHSDHLGSAGWLCARFEAPMLMSEAEYLTGLMMQIRPREAADAIQHRFFVSHGMDAQTTATWVANGHRYLRMMSPIPDQFHRLAAGDVLEIGGREFDIHTVAGHSPEEVLMHQREGRILIAADQITPKLAPNLAVQANDPDGDPLRYYLNSLDYIDSVFPADSMVLPSHEVPYRSLHFRTDKLRQYYARRCEVIANACRDAPHTATDLIPRLWRNPPDGTWIGFVVSEIVTYLNHMVALNRLTRIRDGEVFRFSSTMDTE